MSTATPAAAGEPLLALDDLHVYYGAIHALKGVSLEVRRGEVVTLIGANGAGKSTTLRAISGLARPRPGRIALEGRDISRLPAHRVVREGIAHAPEGRRLFPRMSVLENLEMGAFAHGERSGDDLDRVYALFPRLHERRDQQAGTLSGGEQQMVAIGRALMARPRLLLLDEPSMGLAPLMVERIFATILEISAQGTTILLVEQNARAALEAADRGYVMETGRVVIDGEAARLLDDERVRKAYLGQA